MKSPPQNCKVTFENFLATVLNQTPASPLPPQTQ